MKYYTDGFCYVKNPSPVGGGYTIIDEDSKLIECKVIKKQDFTNNEAELLGVYKTAQLANCGDIISTDSTNTIKWIFKISNRSKRADLNTIKLMIRKLLKEKGIKIIWESRHLNLAGKYNERMFDK